MFLQGVVQWIHAGWQKGVCKRQTKIVNTADQGGQFAVMKRGYIPSFAPPFLRSATGEDNPILKVL